jgi:predicted GNAT family acetyltransferase
MNSTSLHGVRTNPVWAALTTGNKTLAEGHGLALRYPPEICAFAGMKSPTPEAYEQLLALVPGSGRISLLTADNSKPPTPFSVQHSIFGYQMEAVGPVLPDQAGTIVEVLGEADASEMVQLTALTRPGPFEPRTYRLGRYLGIRIDGRLVAMAGERLRFTNRIEISAVCVHPDFRRRGYAELLMAALMRMAKKEGIVPLLHVAEGNPAIALYQRLGFEIVQPLYLIVLQTTGVA